MFDFYSKAAAFIDAHPVIVMALGVSILIAGVMAYVRAGS